jgi:hypothetical protein
MTGCATATLPNKPKEKMHIATVEKVMRVIMIVAP